MAAFTVEKVKSSVGWCRKMELKKAVKTIMSRHSVSAVSVAKRLGISGNGLYKMVNGNPSLKKLQGLSDAIGCPLSEIILEMERKPEDLPFMEVE